MTKIDPQQKFKAVFALNNFGSCGRFENVTSRSGKAITFWKEDDGNMRHRFEGTLVEYEALVLDLFQPQRATRIYPYPDFDLIAAADDLGIPSDMKKALDDTIAERDGLKADIGGLQVVITEREETIKSLEDELASAQQELTKVRESIPVTVDQAVQTAIGENTTKAGTIGEPTEEEAEIEEPDAPDASEEAKAKKRDSLAKARAAKAAKKEAASKSE